MANSSTKTGKKNRHSSSALLTHSTDVAGPLREEYQEERALFELQPPLIQRFLEAQARLLADPLIQRTSQARFKLPDRVVVPKKPGVPGSPVPVPSQSRDQLVGGLLDGL